MKKTNSAVPQIKRTKYELDATGQAPGRLASKIAMILMGKNKTDYVPYLDLGGKVVVLNADKVKLTGKKNEQKIYRHHSMHPGGLKVKKIKDVKPEDVIKNAVAKMLPKNQLRPERMKRLSFK